MHLIAGLGNPGSKYELTRHNIGFLVIDEMTKNYSTTNINKSNFQSITLKSNNIVFAKPQTFMNLSGDSIVSIKKYFNIENDKIIVVHDDLDLPFGTIKYKIGGGHGGHNGLKSIDSHIGKEYVRIRVGIGKPKEKNDVANYVLSNFSKEELKALEDIIPRIVDAIEFYIKSDSIEELKSKFTMKL